MELKTFASLFGPIVLLYVSILISFFLPVNVQFFIYRRAIKWGYPIVYFSVTLIPAITLGLILGPIIGIKVVLYGLAYFIVVLYVFRYIPFAQKYINSIQKMIIKFYNAYGSINEAELFSRIALLKGFGRYPLISNVLLQVGENQYTEIDHVLVTDAGIFVFEVKDYHGYIEANAYTDKWIRSNRKGQRELIPNALQQNSGHVTAIFSLLEQFGFSDIQAYNFVVLGYSGYWWQISDLYPGTCCCRISNMKKNVKQFLSLNKHTLDKKIVSELGQIIAEHNITDPYARQQHVINCMEKDEARYA